MGHEEKVLLWARRFLLYILSYVYVFSQNSAQTFFFDKFKVKSGIWTQISEYISGVQKYGQRHSSGFTWSLTRGFYKSYSESVFLDISKRDKN